MRRERLIDGTIGRQVDVRRTIVTVHAIHFLSRHLCNLRLIRIGRVVLGDVSLAILNLYVGNNLTFGVRGIVDGVGDVHVPVNSAGLTFVGISATGFDEETKLSWSALLVVSEMVDDLELGSPEFAGPVTLFASFRSRTKILDWASNRTWEGSERGLEYLANAAHLGTDIPSGSGADVAIDATYAGVRRSLMRGVFGMHDDVAELSAELGGVSEFVGSIAADGAGDHEDHDEGQEESEGAALRRIVEIQARKA